MLADVPETFLACRTLPAGLDRPDDHPVTGLDAVNAFANLADHTGALMTDDRRKRHAFVLRPL